MTPEVYARGPHARSGAPARAVVDVGGALVGTVSWYWESEETQWARMGVTVFDPSRRGHGVGRESLGATDWVRLDLATWSGNAAMVAVARALGFVEEGRVRRARASTASATTWSSWASCVRSGTAGTRVG